MLTIGKLAKQARVTTDTIRFYERVGLIAAASKTTSGYRLYTDEAVKRLAFIRHAQRCGFSLPEIRELLQNSPTKTPECYALAVRKKTDIDQTIGVLRAMSAALSTFIGETGLNGAVSTATPARPETSLVTALAAHVESDPERKLASEHARARQSYA
jgi:DNA-binding transcriptional MerR regulator